MVLSVLCHLVGTHVFEVNLRSLKLLISETGDEVKKTIHAKILYCKIYSEYRIENVFSDSIFKSTTCSQTSRSDL